MKRVALAVFVAGLATGAWLTLQWLTPFSKGAPVVVNIASGEAPSQLAQQLVASGVLRGRLPFLVLYWIGRVRHQSLKAGEYRFDRPLSTIQVYRKIVRGEVFLHAVLIPEGSNRWDMARILHARIGMDAAAFLEAASDPGPVRDLDPQANSLEGYLFPDTYFLPRGATPGTVVARMLIRFRREMRVHAAEGLPAGGEELHRVMVLASLVEKETPKASERPLIAGVFVRRLQMGMPLQCDPTVIYAMDLSDPAGAAARSPITRSGLENPSPYNTYAHAGLPPGPICSPGLAAILAAAHPAAGDALYFVSDNAGGHVFSKTLAAHHEKVRRYRRNLANQHKAAPTQHRP
jgi:UPF0755 protein